MIDLNDFEAEKFLMILLEGLRNLKRKTKLCVKESTTCKRTLIAG